MTDVMHHIPDPQDFLAEARRTLTRGGRILMVEPWVSAWSRFIYTRFHSEPFRPEASSWSFPLWTSIERLVQPWMRSLAMFAFIRLDRG